MIQPGLARVTRLLADSTLTWRAIHVAGTNGKGSVCNYAARMLDIYNGSRSAKHVTWGKFTSPHLIDRWDGIQLNGEVIDKQMFSKLEEQMLDYNEKHQIGASEFEILTAVAFNAFTASHVEIGIVEVGMGGAQDSTNILGTGDRPAPLVSAITKIGLDHQAFLGNTLADIARQKAGIIKPGVPVVYDRSNAQEVIDVIRRRARDCKSRVVQLEPVHFSDTAAVQSNANVALAASYTALEQLGRHPTDDLLHEWARAPESATNAGRLERRVLQVGGKPVNVLLDGAHNAQSAAVLAELLSATRNRTWLYGASQGRDVAESLRLLLLPGDSVFAVEFGQVDGMPWVKPVPASDILAVAQQVIGDRCGTLTSCGKDVAEAFKLSAQHAGSESQLVVTGSLYLIGDVHRVLRNRLPSD